jgi:hypothetical protein
MQKRDCLWVSGGISGKGHGESKGYWGVTYISTYTGRQHNETHQTLKRGGEGKGEWEYNGGVNLFKYTACMYEIITMNPSLY